MKPIGTIHSPFDTLEDMPIQPKGAKEIIGTVELEEQYLAGLADLDGFSHVYLLYQFHMAQSNGPDGNPFHGHQAERSFCHQVSAATEPYRHIHRQAYECGKKYHHRAGH